MKKRTILSCGIAVILCAGSICPAFAQQSPDFAYTEEQWAAFRDNVLEFDEIDELVHEYNPTVLKNAMDYKDFTGKSSTDISDSYYQAAEQIYNNMSYPDDGAANYAGGITSYLNAEISYENLMEQGDKNTNDAETYRLNYARQEANLVKQAQQLMINYWSQYYSLESARNQVTSAQNNLTAAQHRLAAGTGTQNSVLTAEQALTTAQNALVIAETSLNTTKENLCLMLGWGYGAEVDIRPLPELDPAVIAAIDLNADIDAAKAENFSLRQTERQLQNAQTYTVKEQLTVTRDTAVRKIESNVSELYRSVQQSLTELAAAQETFGARSADMAAAERKRAAGMMTEKDYQSAASAYRNAAAQNEVRKLAVRTAYVNYQAAVHGLASTE